jgi:hypothetical protein
MPTELELRDNYSARDTEELLELRSRSTLIPEAYVVLDDILRERGIDPRAAVQAQNQIAQENAHQEVMALALAMPQVERYWRALWLSFTVLLCALALMAVANKDSAWSGIGLTVTVLAMALFYLSLAMLARALKRSALGWVLLAVLLSFLGKAIAITRMHAFVRQARADVRAKLPPYTEAHPAAAARR